MEKMKAMVIEDFGESNIFLEREVDVPSLKENEILVKVAATSVNPIDTILRMGGMPQLVPELPAVIHSDISGTVVKTGNGVKKFSIGDRIISLYGGMVGIQGALADFIAVDENSAAKAPDNIPIGDAASIPLTALTAWESLIEKAQIKKGEKVLVFGGTGGVGHWGVQIAAAMGCEVTATGSSDEKREIAKILGAEFVHDYNNEDQEALIKRVTIGKGFDVVFDTVGGDNIQKSFSLVRPGGRVVTILSMVQVDLSVLQMKNIALHGEFVLLPLVSGEGRATQGDHLKDIVSLINDGKIRPLIHENKFTFQNVGDAHALAESGKFMGKIIVENTKNN